MKESISRAFSYLASKKVEFGMGHEIDNSDFHVEAIDLLNNRVEAEIGVAFFVAAFSALRHSPVTAATLILGDMSIQGNIKEVRSLTEPLQLAHGQRRQASTGPHRKQTPLPRSQRRHHGTRRPRLLRRPKGGGV